MISKFRRLVEGERKDDVCAWWLNHIETQADQFLVKFLPFLCFLSFFSSCEFSFILNSFFSIPLFFFLFFFLNKKRLGFSLTAVPPDYTDRAPDEMELVRKNVQLLQSLKEDCSEDLYDFVDKLTDEVLFFFFFL